VGNVPLVQALFWGVKAAVVAIVFEALLKISKKALKRRMDWVLAALAFVALFFFGLPFLLVVAAAALVGLLVGEAGGAVTSIVRPGFFDTFRTIVIWLAIWLLPLGALYFVYGQSHVYTRLASIFSTLAVVTFGGAYAVLASLGQSVVENTGWMTTQQMMDGFGLAETTPGPLILVGQFVSFTSAHHVEGGLWAGVFASVIFLWMTFAPCFLWISAGAPWIEWLDSIPKLRSALSAITAAVTGVILNLSLWFFLHVVFGKVERLQGSVPVWWPDISTFDGAALVLAGLLGFALLKLKMGIPKTLAIGLAAGLFWKSLIAVI
jgi:chromate transporter